MQLPGRLRDTTLGDVLGTLHRGGATGVLELTEPGFGAVHRVYLAGGSVTACESPRGLRLSEWLLRDGVDAAVLRQSLQQAVAAGELHGRVLVTRWEIDEKRVDRALRAQILARLSVLEGLSDATLRFRAAIRPPRSSTAPLGTAEMLAGRRRRRLRINNGVEASPRTEAAARLGVPATADRATVTRAFRRLVADRHPDRNARDGEGVIQKRNAELRAIVEAYRVLIAS